MLAEKKPFTGVIEVVGTFPTRDDRADNGLADVAGLLSCGHSGVPGGVISSYLGVTVPGVFEP